MSTTPSQTERCLRLLDLLAGHELDGVTNAQLAQTLQVPPSYVTRDLALLREHGWVEEIPTLPGRWRLAPRLVRIAVSYSAAMGRAEDNIRQIHQRYGS